MTTNSECPEVDLFDMEMRNIVKIRKELTQVLHDSVGDIIHLNCLNIAIGSLLKIEESDYKRKLYTK